MSGRKDYRVPLARSYRLLAGAFREAAEARRIEGRPVSSVEAVESMAKSYDTMAARLEAIIEVDATLQGAAL